MAHGTLIGGTAYGITGGKCLVGGSEYAIKKGRTLIGGTGYDILFGGPTILRVTRSTISVASAAYVRVNNGENISSNYEGEYPAGTTVSLYAYCGYADGDYPGGVISVNGSDVVRNSKKPVNYTLDITGKEVEVYLIGSKYGMSSVRITIVNE